MRLATILLLCASPAPAGDAVAVQKALIVTPSGAHLDVQGGCWLDERKCVQTGQTLAQLRAENGQLQQEARHVLLAAATALVLGAGLGFGLGYLASERNRP